MAIARVSARAQAGLAAPEVTVEVHVGGGLPRLNIVGLPEAAVRESADRVRAAVVSAGFDFPSRRITVNLAPADLPKQGGRFDLPIAVGILMASGQLPGDCCDGLELYGELSLTGALRSARGLLPAALAVRTAGRSLIAPEADAAELGLIRDAAAWIAPDLGAVVRHLVGEEGLGRPEPTRASQDEPYPDLADVRGQAQARRALEVAAAGGHGLLLAGPPGTGKTLLASRLPGILPPMSEEEALASAAVRSLAGRLDPTRDWCRRPFRAPHHTASAVALVGGGSDPRPGEISLAHNGVLFLDELPEFSRRVLEVLREPLESGHIVISRAARQAEFPARFQLVAAMNPCPCGYAGDPSGRCDCSADAIRRYRGRISGPLLDRIDLQIEVPRQPARALMSGSVEEGTAQVAARVVEARVRSGNRHPAPNAHQPIELIEPTVRREARVLLARAIERLQLSARVQHRVLRVARTLSDLADLEAVGEDQVAEALAMRALDRDR